jgi:hypothetical protein
MTEELKDWMNGCLDEWRILTNDGRTLLIYAYSTYGIYGKSLNM